MWLIYIYTYIYMYFLAKTKKNWRMSLFIAESDWTTQGITLCSTSNDPNQPDLGTFHSSYDVVFVDPSGYHNMCSHMLESTFYRVRFCLYIKRALNAIAPCSDQNEPIFDALCSISNHKRESGKHCRLGSEVVFLSYNVSLNTGISLQDRKIIFLSTLLSQLMRLWYLSHTWPVKAQASLRICAVSPEPLLFAHMKYGSKRKGLTKNQTSSPTGWLCMRVWRMSLRRTKSMIISWDGSINQTPSVGNGPVQRVR